MQNKGDGSVERLVEILEDMVENKVRPTPQMQELLAGMLEWLEEGGEKGQK